MLTRDIGSGINFSLVKGKTRNHESLIDHLMFCNGLRDLCLSSLQDCQSPVPGYAAPGKTMEDKTWEVRSREIYGHQPDKLIKAALGSNGSRGFLFIC